MILVSFSGGRTSAKMCDVLLKKHRRYRNDLIFVFANTGQEDEETLIFVDKVDRHFELNLTWVEAVIHMRENMGTTFRIVDFKSATRDISLFRQMTANIAHLAQNETMYKKDLALLYTLRYSVFNKETKMKNPLTGETMNLEATETQKQAAKFLLSKSGYKGTDNEIFELLNRVGRVQIVLKAKLEGFCASGGQDGR